MWKKNFSLDILGNIFPEIVEQAFFQDLYKAFQPIRRNGNRLYGSEPYEHDPSFPQHFEATWMSAEDGKSGEGGEIVLLLGSNVRDTFKRKYGVPDIPQSGVLMGIGGRQRRVFHIRHPEHTGLYANRKQLEQLKSILLHLQEYLTVDISYVERLINRKATTDTETPGRRVHLTAEQCEAGWSVQCLRDFSSISLAHLRIYTGRYATVLLYSRLEMHLR